jgi:dihydrofolate reductase
MRKLILQMQMSVDGFVDSRHDGPRWTLWDWASDSPWDAALLRRFNETLAEVDTVLLSGPMADGYIRHWTGMAASRGRDPDYAFTNRIVAAHKRVVSQSVRKLAHPRTTIGNGPLLDEVAALKRQAGRTIICFGGVGFATSLLQTGEVDELQLYVNPSALSDGDSIFDKPRRLELIDATPFACGIVVQRYRPAAALAD